MNNLRNDLKECKRARSARNIKRNRKARKNGL